MIVSTPDYIYKATIKKEYSQRTHKQISNKIVNIELDNLKYGWGQYEILWQKYKQDKLLNIYRV